MTPNEIVKLKNVISKKQIQIKRLKSDIEDIRNKLADAGQFLVLNSKEGSK